MKEIEVKAHLKDREWVVKKLTELGCVLSAPIRQIDVVYTKIVGTVPEFLTNDHFLRIRERSDGKYIFTVKKPSKGNALTKAEHETEIKNKEEMEQALFLMGYKLANKVIKVRQTGHVNGYEICLDEVEELGSFIEVEKLSDEDPEAVRKEIETFLFSLDVAREDEVHKGYDILMIEKTSS